MRTNIDRHGRDKDAARDRFDFIDQLSPLERELINRYGLDIAVRAIDATHRSLMKPETWLHQVGRLPPLTENGVRALEPQVKRARRRAARLRMPLCAS